jgi:hypothetical protein
MGDTHTQGHTKRSKLNMVCIFLVQRKSPKVLDIPVKLKIQVDNREMECTVTPS